MLIQRLPSFKKWGFYHITVVCALAMSSSFCDVNAVYGLSFFNNTVSFYSDGTPIDDTHFSNTETDRMSALNDKENLDNTQNTESIRALDNKPFNWDHYSDPNNPQFWDAGGDFIPSLPWRYLMTHPTKENADKYNAWLAAKMALTVSASRLMTPISQTVSTQPSSHTENQDKQNAVGAKTQEDVNSSTVSEKSINWSTYTIAFFYQTQCPYCQKSEPIYSYLKDHGAHMVPVQLDSAQNPPAIEGSTPYTAEMDAQFHVTGTPTWIIKSATTSPRRIDGYASLAELERQAQEGGNTP